jgi:hypothetical protein
MAPVQTMTTVISVGTAVQTVITVISVSTAVQTTITVISVGTAVQTMITVISVVTMISVFFSSQVVTSDQRKYSAYVYATAYCAIVLCS